MQQNPTFRETTVPGGPDNTGLLLKAHFRQKNESTFRFISVSEPAKYGFHGNR